MNRNYPLLCLFSVCTAFTLCISVVGTAIAQTTTSQVSPPKTEKSVPLSVSISSDKKKVPIGSTATISFTSRGASECTAPWMKTMKTADKALTKPLLSKATYIVTCVSSTGVRMTKSVDIEVTQAALTFNVSSKSVSRGGAVVVTWFGDGLQSCIPSWTKKATTTRGNYIKRNITDPVMYSIECKTLTGATLEKKVQIDIKK
jgi:hypothetical protein